MKSTYFSYLLLAGVCLACSTDETDRPSTPGVTVYDEALLPGTVDPLTNLIANGSFESDGNLFTCGSVRVAPAPEAPDGQRGLIFDEQGACEAGSRSVVAVASQQIDLQQVPDLLTLSFRIRAEGEVPSGNFTVYLTDSPEGSTQLFGGYFITTLSQEANQSSRWDEVSLIVSGDQIARNLDGLPLYLAFQFTTTEGATGATIFVDDVRATDGYRAITQSSPMPDALRNYAGDSRLLFYNAAADDPQVATMLPNGTDMVVYEAIPAATVEGLPAWFSDTEVTLAQKTFTPAIPDDPSVQPAGGTQVVKYDLVGGNSETVYETVGEPGRFLFEGSLDNVAALDVEVRRMRWDLTRNRGVLTVCGRNRSPQLNLNSDDVCFLYLVDAATYQLLNSDVNGFAPAWSASGQLAYYYDDQLWVAEVTGDNIDGRVVASRPNLLQGVDWSPDETQLVMAELGGGSAVINGEIESVYTIKTLDLATGERRPLLRVDHGQLLPNLSWSPDGAFIIYSLRTDGGAQVWWLEVATGQTGPITNTINGFGATWRK